MFLHTGLDHLDEHASVPSVLDELIDREEEGTFDYQSRNAQATTDAVPVSHQFIYRTTHPTKRNQP